MKQFHKILGRKKIDHRVFLGQGHYVSRKSIIIEKE